MAAKRAKRKQSRGAARPGAGMSKGGNPLKSAGMAWFLVGAISGSLATWAAVGRDHAAEQVRTALGRTVGHTLGTSPAEPRPKPKFEFYEKLLEEREVVVPEEALASPQPAKNASVSEDASAGGNAPAGEGAPAEGKAPADEDAPAEREGPAGEEAAAAKPEGPYIVQVASFKSMKDADGLKAKLLLGGFQPVVQSVVISGEEKRYRVRLGPYPDRASLDAARGELRANGYDNPLVIQVKRG